MTVRELYSEVLALGFGTDIELDAAFSTFASRALLSFFHEREIMSSHRFYATGQIPIMHIKEIRHIGGEERVIPLVGRAYSMRVFGKGCVTVSDRSGSFTRDFNSDGGIISGFLSGDGELLLAGAFSYTVTELVTYSEVFSDDKADIPDGSKRVAYDIRAQVGDFLAFTEPPTDRYGRIIKAARLYDGRVELDSAFRGEVNIKYRRLPKKIYSDLPEQRVDIPDQYTHLLPLLVASFILLDDEPERAEYYSSMYKEGLEQMKKKDYERVDIPYIDTTGWA